MRGSWILALTLLPAAAACGGTGAAGLARAPRAATTAAITAADLRIRESIFSDDSMLGRRAGTIGNVRGNAYIAGGAGAAGPPARRRRRRLPPAGAAGELRGRHRQGRRSRAGSATLTAFHDYYPYQAEFDLPARPLDGAQVGVHRHAGRHGRLPEP